MNTLQKLLSASLVVLSTITLPNTTYPGCQSGNFWFDAPATINSVTFKANPTNPRNVHFLAVYQKKRDQTGWYSEALVPYYYVPVTVDGLTSMKDLCGAMDNSTVSYYWSEGLLTPVWRKCNPAELPVEDDPSRLVWIPDLNINTEIIFDKTPLKADDKSYVIASLSNPAAFNNAYTWKIAGETLGCSLTEEVRNGQTVAIIKGYNLAGRITVRAIETGNDGRFVDKDLPVVIDCENCGNCITQAKPANNSVDFTIALEKGNFGDAGAVLRIKTDAPDADLGRPIGLKFYRGSADILTVTNFDSPKQYISPNIVTEVKPVSGSDSQYTITAYKTSDMYAPGGWDPIFYVPHAGVSALITWTVSWDAAQNQLTITEVRDGKTIKSRYIYSGTPSNHTWDLLTEWDFVADNGTKKETRNTVVSGNVTTETYTITDLKVTPNVVRHQVVNTYTDYGWGKELTDQVIGTGANNLTTTWRFYELPADGYNYRRPKQVTYPGGKWEKYLDYDVNGRAKRIVSQFKNNAFPNSTAEEDANRVTAADFTPTSNYDEKYVVTLGDASTVIAHKLIDKSSDADYDIVEEQICTNAVGGATWNAAGNLITKTWTYRTDAAFPGKIKKIKHADGTFSIYTYAFTYYGGYAIERITTLDRGVTDGSQNSIIDGERTVTVVDPAGNLISEKVFDLPGLRTLSSKVGSSPDPFGRRQIFTYLDTKQETYTYDCCSVIFKDKAGVTSTNVFDEYRRLVSVGSVGIVITNAYDVAGRIWKTVRTGSNGVFTVLNMSGYDDAGRLIKSTNALNQVTSFSENVSTHEKTTTFPNTSSTRIETYFADGTLQKISGTSVHELRYDYGADTGGEWAQEIRVRSGSEAEWVKTYKDLAGRTYKAVYPDGALSSSTFNQKNQLIKTVDPDTVTTLFNYNSKGELTQTAIDLNANGTIETSADRVTETELSIPAGTPLVRRKKTTVWDDIGNPPVPTAIVTSQEDLNVTEVDSSVTGFGQLTQRHVDYYPTDRKKKITETLPDGSKRETGYLDGRLEYVTRFDNVTPTPNQIGKTSYVYDDHGRLKDVIDARNDSTTSYTYYDDDRVKITTTPIPGFGDVNRQSTTNVYDDINASGRIERIQHYDGTKTTNEYHLTGELKKASGSRAYQVEYTYEQGRVRTMKTWTNTAVANPATTTWTYTSDRGFLDRKTYNDGKYTSYQYWPSGKLKRRTWYRGVYADYTYNAAGDLAAIDYSDVTGNPNVSYTYNRRGLPSGITDPNGTHELTYSDSGLLFRELHTTGVLAGLATTNTYDNRLRRDTVRVQLSGADQFKHNYGYNAAGRMSEVYEGPTASDPSTKHVTYGYLTDSPLIQTTTFRPAGSGGAAVLTTTKNYDYLNRVKDVTSVAGNTFSFAYQYNSANQRTRAILQDSSYWDYRYDSLGQVTNGIHFWSDNSFVAGQQFEYYFDHIGNRTKTRSGGDNYGIKRRVTTYTPNQLNQYSSRKVPGSVDIIGTAHADSTVTVDTTATQRKGDYFRADVPLDNSVAPKYQTITVRGVRPDSGQDVMTEETRSLVASPSTETFTYDGDGNLTADGIWNYTWDAENRLIAMENNGVGSPPNSSRKRLEFAYDYDGRRISKVVKTWDGNQFANPVTAKFIYAPRNLVAELDSGNAVLRSYMWGLDLSGSEQGAGGVGGLLAIKDTTATYFPAYDGGGNVTSLIKSDGSTSAQYEYGPFGEAIRITGTVSGSNPLRFSTKYTDVDSGHIAFPYRPYMTDGGRWLSREPLGELMTFTTVLASRQPAEAALLASEAVGPAYGFLGNNPINMLDKNGLESWAFAPYFQYRNGQWVYTRPPWVPAPPPLPYVIRRDANGLITTRITKCHVVVFYGHGFGDYDRAGNRVDFGNLTVNQLNQSDVPAVIVNEPCSAAGVLGCNSGNYVRIQVPIPDAPQPTRAYHIFENGPLIDKAWAAAIAHAKTICNQKDQCCSEVKVRFECPELSFWERPAGWCGKQEIIKCR